MKNNEQLVDPG